MMFLNFSDFPLEAVVLYAVRCTERVYPIYGIVRGIPEHHRHLRDLNAAIKEARAFALDNVQWNDWRNVYRWDNDESKHRLEQWDRRLKRAEIYAQAAEVVASGSALAAAKVASQTVAAARKAFQTHEGIRNLNYGGSEFYIGIAEGECSIHARDACTLALEAVKKQSEHEVDIASRAAVLDHSWVLENLRNPSMKRLLLDRSLWPEKKPQYWQMSREMLAKLQPIEETGNLPHLVQSTFISYGRPDEDFARRLNDALTGLGVTTYFFPKDSVPGKTIHRHLRQQLNDFDKVILVCSRNSLNRPGVLNEIEETLRKEARCGGQECLIPVAIDNFLFEEWKPANGQDDLKKTILDRVVADFRGLSDDTEFVQAVQRILSALRKPTLTQESEVDG